MIEYKQVEGDAPQDIEVTLDDVNAQLAVVQDALPVESGLVAALNYDAAIYDGVSLTFVIPGDEAMDVADAFEEVGIDSLVAQLDKWNAQRIAAAEGSE